MLCMCVYAESTTTTNMSQRNTNRISDRFRPTYNALKRSKKNPYSGQISDRTGDAFIAGQLSNEWREMIIKLLTNQRKRAWHYECFCRARSCCGDCMTT